MKLGDGVEQAIHCVTVLATLPADGLLSAASLAEFAPVYRPATCSSICSYCRGPALCVRSRGHGVVTGLQDYPVTSACLISCWPWKGPSPPFSLQGNPPERA